MNVYLTSDQSPMFTKNIMKRYFNTSCTTTGNSDLVQHECMAGKKVLGHKLSHIALIRLNACVEP